MMSNDGRVSAKFGSIDIPNGLGIPSFKKRNSVLNFGIQKGQNPKQWNDPVWRIKDKTIPSPQPP
jgi:hypothetical protein